MKKGFSAAAAIARQQATIEAGLAHYRAQKQRVESDNILGYWRAELEFRKDVKPISEPAEVAMMALRQLVTYLESKAGHETN